MKKKVTKKTITEEFVDGELVKRITEETIEEQEESTPFVPITNEKPPWDKPGVRYL